MTTCSECGSRMQQELLASYHEDLIGIPVVLKNAVTRWSCPNCSNEMIEVPDLDGLVAAVAFVRCLIPVRLSGSEYRFLRKVLDMTREEFAELVDNTPGNVAQRESDLGGIGGYAETVVRQKVCERLKSRAPAVDDDLPWIATELADLPPMVFERIKFKSCEPRHRGRHWDIAEVDQAA